MVSGLVSWLFGPPGLTPHGVCLLWEPGLIWLHAVSDAVTGLAYFSIPLALAIVARRRKDLVFRPVFILFAAFIVLCGTGHMLDLLTLWIPVYSLEGTLKAMTAAVSILTAVTLWHLLPQALTLPSPDQLRTASIALRESEARYRINFKQSPVPLHTLDGDGKITGVSNSWLRLLGYRREEVIGRHIAEFQAPNSAPWSQTDRAILHAEGEVLERERLFVRSDGEVITGSVSARLEVRNGEDHIVCVLQDITARRRAEEALRRSEEQLHQAQKMEAIGNLTGGIAHDFNNMLQGVAGALDVMERRLRKDRPADLSHYISLARQSVNRAAGLTYRLLAFARRQSLLPTAVDTSALVRGMADLIGRTVGPAITIDLALDDTGWLALCDANQLESALLNLAINARDAMPDGGTLTIATAARRMDTGDLSGTEDAAPGDYVQITVTDTGCGMAPDIIPRVFEPFFTTKPLGRGTGLGLSQIYGFVRQSGGIVRLDSAPGRGTTVTLFLPRAGQAAAPGQQPQDFVDNPADLSGRVILLVEDESSIRDLMAETLVHMGCTVMQAVDGPSGLGVIQSRQQIDLMITDVGMPGLNGRQLADAARSLRPGLPILITTGYAGHSLDDMDLTPGVAVLRKPFSLDALAAHVTSLVRHAITA